MNTAYVYKWTHLPTLNWYVGSRTSARAKLNDKYICSSNLVKQLIQANPEEWERTIIDNGEPLSMYDLESEILQASDARNDPRSLNKHNNDGKWTNTGNSWNGARQGKNNPMFGKTSWNKGLTKETSASLAAIGQASKIRNTGQKRPKAHCDAIRQSLLGNKLSDETKAKIGKANKGKKRQPLSAETLVKMANARRLYWANKRNDCQ